MYHLRRHSEWSNTIMQRNFNARIQLEGVTIWRHLYNRESCVHVCLSVAATTHQPEIMTVVLETHQIKSKQVYGKWDGPWRADTLIWNQDNFSDSVYTTFVYWYKNSFCLQINAIRFSFCTQNQTTTLISRQCISNMEVRSHALHHLIYVDYYFFFSTAVILEHLLHYIIQWQNPINFIKFYRIFL